MSDLQLLEDIDSILYEDKVYVNHMDQYRLDLFKLYCKYGVVRRFSPEHVGSCNVSKYIEVIDEI
jgi:hypothetical protein